MPRRHKRIKYIPPKPIDTDRGKNRYPNKLEAERAAERGMLLDPQLELSVYQDIDGGWYLTRRKSNHDKEL